MEPKQTIQPMVEMLKPVLVELQRLRDELTDEEFDSLQDNPQMDLFLSSLCDAEDYIENHN